MKAHKTLLLCVASALIAFSLGFWSRAVNQPLFTSEAEQHAGEIGLINPLLQCDLGEEYISKNSLRPFKSIVDDAINVEKTKGNITFASIYFRDLNNGTWFGSNVNEEFYPASLLKLPLLLEVLYKADRDHAFLSQKIQYINKEKNPDAIQYFKPEKELVTGETYTVKEIAEHMIRYSDNNAADVLAQLIGPEAVLSIFKQVGIDTPPTDPEKDFLTVRQYASFFRILFNASFLSREYSEAALSLLSTTTFTHGIVAGVPHTITVANKFGEKSDADNSSHQLHDCGIVYYPKHPYLLCVMTRGANFDQMTNSIASLSKTVYTEVNNQLTQTKTQ